MSRPEDKTVQTLRTLSEKRACTNQGSVIAHGGIYVGKNLECEEDLVTGELVVRGLSKLAGDVSIGGIVYCPEIYSITDHDIHFKRNLVPGKLRNSAKPLDKSSLGTKDNPWENIHTKSLAAAKINIADVQAETVCTKNLSTPVLVAGKNSVCVQPGQISLNDNLNIVNPSTNEIMASVSNNMMETFVPVYKQWNSFKSVTVCYDPNVVLFITVSNIFIEVGNIQDIIIEFDGNKVPDNTKVKFYFTNQNQTVRVKFQITIVWKNQTFIFRSVNLVNKTKFIFTGDKIFLV